MVINFSLRRMPKVIYISLGSAYSGVPLILSLRRYPSYYVIGCSEIPEV